MCADFHISDAITRRNEGGWQNMPEDSGNNDLGWGTYKGLASAKQPKWRGWPIVVAEIAKKPTQPTYGSKAYRVWVKELNAALEANLELQRLVETYYKANFWDVNSLDKIRCQGAANHIYDHGVSRGTVTAALILQKVLGVMADGDIGPVTIKAANKMRDNELEALYRAARKVDYNRLCDKVASKAQYRGTWLARC
jgi:lysozyme family protein